MRAEKIRAGFDAMKRRGLPVLAFGLAATTARADGVSPILNLFHSETWLPATVVTLAIILIESLLLRGWLRPIAYRRALAGSVLINVVSSGAGSLLLLLFGRHSYFMWDTLALVPPLFGITLATEIPLIRFFPKPKPISWKRAAWVGIGLNIVSYAAVFALEIGLLAAFLFQADARDKRDRAAWNQPALLAHFTGTLCATTWDSGPRLRFFDPQTQTWSSPTNAPAFDLRKWDVEGSRCAFVDADDGALKIATFPELSVLREIPAQAWRADETAGNERRQEIAQLALSPDARRLALLFRTAEVVAPRDESSFFHLGDQCRLIVLDVESGREIARAPRRASGTDLAWLPDSRSVLFASFDDETLYDVSPAAVRGQRSVSLGYARDGRFASRLYAFHLDAGDVTPFAHGHSPSVASRAQRILVRDDNHLRLLDPGGREIRRFPMPFLRGSPAISPDGALVFADLRRHSPFSPAGVPILFAPTAPDVRHALPGTLIYRSDWTGSPADADAP